MASTHRIECDITPYSCIYLVWSSIKDGKPEDTFFNITPVPVKYVRLHEGVHLSCPLFRAGSSARKVLYIKLDEIIGADVNSEEPQSTFALREVIGIK